MKIESEPPARDDACVVSEFANTCCERGTWGCVHHAPQSQSYENFIDSKIKQAAPAGFDPETLSEYLFPFQRDIVRWALRRGKGAIFADTGLGKTPMMLEWIKHVVARTGKPGLIMAPLAVAKQIAREGEKFGIHVTYLRDGLELTGLTQPIIVTNYERLDKFPAHHFGGVVIDESSILKSFDGKTRDRIIEAFQDTPFRIACTATPAPNDTTELGNHAEFLGVMTRAEMLAMYFFHDGGDTSKWTLKGHARESFWKWVASWAVVVRRPSDVHPDYDDERFKLPPITYHCHTIAASPDAAKEQGRLFVEAASTLTEQRKVRRETLGERCKLAASLVQPEGPALVWCELNDESEELAEAIPGSEEIRGNDDSDDKERKIIGFVDGVPRVAITKPKLAGLGVNWQHCAHVVFVGITHSWESYYQAVRRCYRFGQTQPVRVDIVTSELEGKVLENLRRKEAEAAEMAEEMVSLTRDQMRIELGTMTPPKIGNEPAERMVLPWWMK